MKYVPNAVSRAASTAALKLSGASPTILVVGGVIGMGATAVMAARATRKVDPIVEDHAKARIQIAETSLTHEQERKDVVALYSHTTVELAKVYAPTIIVGTVSAVAILGGHRILRGRHAASVLAFSGLQDQFLNYRRRVRHTLGNEMEKAIFDGAVGEYVEDPDHKGEYKLEPKWKDEFQDPDTAYLRPWFDETNPNFTRDAAANRAFLQGVQQHQNNMLQIRGHVMLNDVFDALAMPRCKEGAIVGWVLDPASNGDGYIDFGFETGIDPHTVAFRNQLEKTVRFNFNIDGEVWQLIKDRRFH